MSVKQRLIEFIKHKNLSQSRFEKAVGLSNGYINNISKGIGAEKLQKILHEFPELNSEWLLSGNGEMLNTSDHPPIEIDPVSGGEINVSQLMNMMQKQMDMVNSVIEQNKQLLNKNDKLVAENEKLMRELMKLGKEERPAIEDFGSVEDRQ